MTTLTTNAPDAALTTQEQDELAHHEAIIQRGIDTFVEVGNALAAIREARLYRAQFATFEAYCRERWDIGRSRAYQMISAAAVVTNVSTIVDTPAPTNEAQARPLTSLPPEQQAPAWRDAVAAAPNGRPTAADVKAVVEARRPPPPAPVRPATSPALPPALPVAPAAPATLPPSLPGLAAAPAPLASPTPMLQFAVLAALLSAASSQATRAWEEARRELMERGQFPELIIRNEQLTLAAQQLLDAPAVKMAAGFLGMAARLQLEQLDGSPIEAEIEAEEVIA